MGKAITREQFIERWLVRCSYMVPQWFVDQFQFLGMGVPTEFWCPTHGTYTTAPRTVLKSKAVYSTPGCHDCSKDVRRENIGAARVEAHLRRDRKRVAAEAERRKRIIAARQPSFVTRARISRVKAEGNPSP